MDILTLDRLYYVVQCIDDIFIAEIANYAEHNGIVYYSHVILLHNNNNNNNNNNNDNNNKLITL